jgi:hypothetical protein
VTNYILVVAIMFFFEKIWCENLYHQDLLPNAVAHWGSRVIGTDEGDGWLKVWRDGSPPRFFLGFKKLM